MSDIPQISATELQQYLSVQDNILLLDVREDDEVALCALLNHDYIPMNLIPLRHNELPAELLIVLCCHNGIRSLQVAMHLAHLCFETVITLKGGIEAWAAQIDPTIARY